jgi:site-specific DNA-methyltransferase (adenine-specific)
VARKPLAGTVSANVLQYGAGALHIDACRVELNGDYKSQPNGRPSLTGLGDNYDPATANKPDTAGRWPTNVVLDDSQAGELDSQTGVLKSGANPTRRSSDEFRNTYSAFGGQAECIARRGADEGGASRFFPVFRYCAKAPSEERPYYQQLRLRLRGDLTPEELDRVMFRLREGGVDVE